MTTNSQISWLVPARAKEGSLHGARRRNNVGGSKGGCFESLGRREFGVVRLSVLTILQLPITPRALRGEVSSRGQTFYRLRFTAYDEYCRAEYCDFVEEKTRFIREKL